MRFRSLIKIVFIIQISFFTSLTFNTSFAQQTKSLEHWQQITDKDPKDALAWFNIGVLYEKGHGVQVNQIKAQQSYTKSINLGYAPAMFNLGSIYAQNKDYINAKFWWEKAANESVPEAQYNLATLYEKGWGVKPDQEKASLWYQRAAETAMEKYLDLYQNSKEKLKEQSALSQTSVSIFDHFSIIPLAIAATDNEFQVIASELESIDLVEVAQATTTVKQSSSGWPWIYSQPEENFTIQLFATKEESKTAKFIQQYALTERAKVISAIVKGTQYYKVILGSFIEWNDAAVEIGGLPQDLRDERPWVRKFATLYPELPEGTDISVLEDEIDAATVETSEKEVAKEAVEANQTLVESEQQSESIQEESEQEVSATEEIKQAETIIEPKDVASENPEASAEKPVSDEQQEKLTDPDNETVQTMPEKTISGDSKPDDVFTLYANKLLSSNGLADNNIKQQLQSGLDAIKMQDHAQAFEQLSPLADAGLAEAQFRLALLYAEGKGVGLDLDKAFEFAKLSAEQGHPYGQRLLAEFYNNGIGVEANTSLASYWQQTGDDNIKKLEEL